MKKLLLPLILLPLMLGFAGKNPVRTDAFGAEIQYALPDPIPSTAAEFIDYWNNNFNNR